MTAATLRPLSPIERREAGWFFAIALLVIGAGFGLRDPWPADEPRFVLVAQQMIDSGDWWFPRRGHELYPDKPPLFMWLLGLASLAVGGVRWSFLLPSLVASMGTLWLTWDLGRRLWNPRAGLWAAAAVLVVPAFVYQAKRAQIDPVLIGLTTLALYGMLRHLLLGPAWRWFALGAFAAGLGVWTKGVGFLPLLALLPFALMRWKGWSGIAPLGSGNGWRWTAGVAMFFLAIIVWFVPMVLMALYDGDPSHRAYLDNLLFKQTITRYADAWHHHEPVWYFLEVIALFWAPLSIAFLWLVVPWRAAWISKDARVWLPLAWALLVIAFFSGSTGKRDMYILPALPGFALAAAPYLEAIARRKGFRVALLGWTGLLGAVLVAGGLAALFSEPRFEARIVAERGLGTEAAWLWGMLVAVGGIGLAAVAFGRLKRALHACAALLIALWLGWGFVVHPLLDDENSARGIVARANAALPPGGELGLLAWKEQHLLQAGLDTAEFGFCPDDSNAECQGRQMARATAWVRAAPATRVLLARDLPGYGCIDFDAAGNLPLGTANRREFVLVGVDALTRCAAATDPGPGAR
jgi:4-amino-4-deoxy-L-arabinose transferase-like glycosyltransferase